MEFIFIVQFKFCVEFGLYKVKVIFNSKFQCYGIKVYVFVINCYGFQFIKLGFFIFGKICDLSINWIFGKFVVGVICDMWIFFVEKMGDNKLGEVGV